MNAFEQKRNAVDITITAPSDGERNNETSSDEDEYNYDFETEAVDQSSSNKNGHQNQILEGGKIIENATDGSENTLCERFDSGVSLNEENSSFEEQKSKEEGAQNYEIVGDRVLVERDGKFELVDANEIKAEYFEMLGIKPEATSEDGGTSLNSDASSVHKQSELVVSERPKTTPGFGSRGKDKASTPLVRKRVQSLWGNIDYGNIRSPYGLTEKQVEIKKKRAEAIARRKKEEDERQREEERQKREDAERAFQAWLTSKQEEEKERRKAVSKQNSERDESRAKESDKAFKAWKAAKKKQENNEKQAATRRMEETASMYVVHDRGACEEAFQRWLKKKKLEKKARELEKKKRLRQILRRKSKEPLPVNSDKIRFTDNFGYRNAVVY